METTTAQILFIQIYVILLILLLWLYGHGFSAIQLRTFVNYVLFDAAYAKMIHSVMYRVVFFNV